MRKKTATNRRRHPRLKVVAASRVLVHVFPVLPFLGVSIDADLLNLSAGGMALVMDRRDLRKSVRSGTKLKIHFRLPGSPLSECTAVIRRRYPVSDLHDYIGLRFVDKSLAMARLVNQMVFDNDMCDRRIEELKTPYCDTQCSFFNLCSKPLKEGVPAKRSQRMPLEIALSRAA